MTKLQPILAFAFMMVLTFSLRGQSDKAMPSFEGFHKNIYAELLGSHVFAGINFDMRLNKGRMDGIGFRAGIGGVSENLAGVGIVTFPIEVNHLVGKRRSSFEAGVGILPIYASTIGEITDYDYVAAEGVGFAGGFLTLGYRYQPLGNGFMAQIHWNPLILRGSGFNAGWFGLGLGLGFK